MQFVKLKSKFTFGKPDKKIKDVEPKDYRGIDYKIERKDDLKGFIDDPCLSACEDLFDKKSELLIRDVVIFFLMRLMFALLMIV